ncbi:hypothetical protein niasHT_015416 [Heterodera trifolii]|uniref:c-SKI SMAD4-binding domain-containing protein n=1 Tax=Heterodera trifolii TaxID=157864 RepID=A0ABD2L005_9BILA
MSSELVRLSGEGAEGPPYEAAKRPSEYLWRNKLVRGAEGPLMLDQTPSTSSAAVTYTNLSIDDRDTLMKNLQKLFKTHHQEQNVTTNDQQPGSSTSKGAESRTMKTAARGQNEFPFFTPRDSKYSTLKSTVVDGKALGCFIIGGECRLSFPQMRALCLGEIPTQKIDESMKLLAIVNALATEEQLTVLKRAGLAHPSLSKCELITKTNAERIISLLNSIGTSPIDEVQRSQLHSFRVVHDCFGGCSALLFPELAPNPCFECCICHRMFTPEDFCRHTHQPTSNNNECFWGFDVSNWPFYIRVDDEEAPADEESERQFVAFVQSYSNNQRNGTSFTGRTAI